MVLLNYKKLFLTFVIVITSIAFVILTISAIAQEISTEKSNANTNYSIDILKKINELAEINEEIFETEGTSSHYGKKFHNRKTASGERYNMHSYTAAHRNLPFGTILRITNTENNKSILVRINDRGPFIRKRIIDLSQKSASEIDALGLAKIKIEGFVPGKYEIPEDSKQDYFICYSTEQKPIVLPQENFLIKSTFDDFNNALEHYIKWTQEGIIDPAHTFIALNEISYGSSDDDDNEQFHIAVWKPVSQPKIPVMMAEKVYINE
ncbi:hypothetical protein MASR1M45_00620 [Candidatus Kapaibacterium sp.]